MSGPTLRSSLRRGSSSQTITVTETAGGIDTTSTTSGGTITADLFKNTPVGRNITDIPYLIAGVNDGLGTGRANPSISGATGLENLYIVNGVNINNAGYGAIGTYSTIYGSAGTRVQFDFVQEGQVKSSSFEAQYGRSEEHTSELQSRLHLVCRLLLEKKKKKAQEPAPRHIG